MRQFKTRAYLDFANSLKELYQLKSVLALLDWDHQVNMPPKGAARRAEVTAYLTGLLHNRFLTPEFARLLANIKKLDKQKKLNAGQRAVVREVYREFKREKKLPESFVRDLAQITSEAHVVWVQARKENNFRLFLPYLERIVDLKRQEARYVGYQDSPYDALLDTYEPGARSVEIAKIFGELRDFLVPFVAKIARTRKKPSFAALNGDYPLAKQQELGKQIAKKLGFDLEAGRIDTAVHPFATSFHPEDVRITTRFDKHNLFYSLMSTIHEVGHALYEQGLPAENFGTPLAESVSLGIHESQSRIWENQVGRSVSFWKYFYSVLAKTFPRPFKKLPRDEFYRIFNAVKPSLIRTEADEVTYNLHIIMRFELEKALIEGEIQPSELQKLWEKKTKEYFGIAPKNDREGVLQDVHWSAGLFGYFPTYTLGNLYAAQFYAAAKNVMPDLEKQFARGNFAKFGAWLKENIHIHGKFYSADELCKKVTGQKPNPQFFMDYLQEKYSQIYLSKIPRFAL